MSALSKIMAWWRPTADPETEAEAKRIRPQMETVRTSQISASGVGGLPPTPDVTNPKR